MNFFRLAVTGAMLALLTACGSANIYVKPGTKVDNKIAVVSTNLKLDSIYNETESEIFADSLTMQFMKAGFDVIERNQLDKIRQEHKLAKEGILSQNDAIEIGKIMNIKYIVMSNGVLSRKGSSLFVRQATTKFVNVVTGQTDISGTFAGGGVRTIGAAEKIGDDLSRAINELR